jgi:biotin carboxyl carrier protein
MTSEIIGLIDGKSFSTKALQKVNELAPGQYLITSGSKFTEIFLNSTDTLSDGNVLDGVEVKIQTERDRIIAKHFSELGNGNTSATSGKGIVLKAPMPGMVKAISAAVGDSVEKNTQVIVLEAMKMENSITAGFKGVISKIHVKAGTSVEKNMPMIEFKA